MDAAKLITCLRITLQQQNKSYSHCIYWGNSNIQTYHLWPSRRPSFSAHTLYIFYWKYRSLFPGISFLSYSRVLHFSHFHTFTIPFSVFIAAALLPVSSFRLQSPLSLSLFSPLMFLSFWYSYSLLLISHSFTFFMSFLIKSRAIKHGCLKRLERVTQRVRVYVSAGGICVSTHVYVSKCFFLEKQNL